MDIRFQGIYENRIVHNSFLDKSTVNECMEDSYWLGVKDVFDWLSKMEYLTDNIQYLKEEWENQNRKIL